MKILSEFCLEWHKAAIGDQTYNQCVVRFTFKLCLYSKRPYLHVCVFPLACFAHAQKQAQTSGQTIRVGFEASMCTQLRKEI